MANVTQMGIPGFGAGGILQPKLKHRWRVTFIDMAKGTGISSRDLSVQVINFTRPQLDFDPIQLDRYVSRAYVASKYTIAPCSITIEDDITGFASRVIQAQMETQQRLIGADSANSAWLNAAPTASSYKFAMKLELLDGNEGIVETWYYEGCFILSIDYTDLDYAASEAVQITMQIRYDLAHQDLSGVGAYGTAIGGVAS